MHQTKKFSNRIRNKAAKILIDYKRISQKGWPSITNEILTLIKAPIDANSSPLNRQDIEAWVNRSSKIGDAKFNYVFKFLTHEHTMSRPEFLKCQDLLNDGRICRIADNLIEMYGNCDSFPIYTYDGNRSFDLDPRNHEPDTLLSKFEGKFFAQHDAQARCLFLKKSESAKFLIAHLIEFQRNAPLNEKNWGFVRYSGIAVLGYWLRLYLKSPSDGRIIDAFAAAEIESGGTIPRIHFITDTVASICIPPSFNKKSKYLRNPYKIDLLDLLINLIRDDDPKSFNLRASNVVDTLEDYI